MVEITIHVRNGFVSVAQGSYGVMGVLLLILIKVAMYIKKLFKWTNQLYGNNSCSCT